MGIKYCTNYWDFTRIKVSFQPKCCSCVVILGLHWCSLSHMDLATSLPVTAQVLYLLSHGHHTWKKSFYFRWFPFPQPPLRSGETEALLSTSWCSRCKPPPWAIPPTLYPCLRVDLHLPPLSPACPQLFRTRYMAQSYCTSELHWIY